MSKHTPGPWLIAGENKTFVYALGPMDTNVFWCDAQAAGKERAGKSELEANARLIAQAPRLLDALEQIADYIEERIGDNECRPLENARAAIAAATETND